MRAECCIFSMADSARARSSVGTTASSITSALDAMGSSVATAKDTAQGHAAASQQVAAATQEVLAGVDQVSVTAEALQHHASQLREAVAEFQL